MVSYSRSNAKAESNCVSTESRSGYHGERVAGLSQVSSTAYGCRGGTRRSACITTGPDEVWHIVDHRLIESQRLNKR